MPAAAHRLTRPRRIGAGTHRRWVVAAACLTPLLGGCEEPPAAKVVGSNAPSPGALVLPASAALASAGAEPSAALQPLECRPAAARSGTALIDPAGGTVSVAGVAVMFPPGAASAPTGVTVTVTSSPVMRIDIAADGADAVRFEQPALVTVDYAGCLAPPAGEPLSVWRLDAAERPLERMEGEDDRELRLITFVTGTASRYTIAR